jgi:hypothetical protein
MSSTLTADLRDALAYLYDLTWGEVARTEEELTQLKQTAYWMARAALNRAELEMREARPKNRMELSRVAAVQLEQKLPVKQQIAIDRDALGGRLLAGVTALSALHAVDEEARIKKTKAFTAIATQFTLLAYQAAQPLPGTDACICRACRRIVLPDIGGGYTHCQRIWHPHRANNFHALPDGFWLKYRPGDRYTKRLEDPLDGQGRPEIGAA